MTNTLVTCSIVAKESLAILENMVSFSGMVNRDWEDEFTGNQSRGYSPGQTINIKRPPRYTYRSGNRTYCDLLRMRRYGNRTCIHNCR